MRKIYGLPAAVWVVWALSLFAPGAGLAQAPKGPVSVCYEDEDNHPWFIKGGKGASVLLMEMAATKAGIQVELNSMPWSRCLALLERGASAAALGASFTPDRAQYAVYPMLRGQPGKLNEEARLRHDEYMLYRRVGTPVSWDGKAFSGLEGAIGYQSAYSIGSHLRERGVATLDGSKSAEVVLRRVLTGDLQGAALQAEFADRLLTQPEFNGKIEKVLPPLIEKSYFLAFNKTYYADNEPVAAALWAAIEKARKSPEYRDVMVRFNGQPLAEGRKK